MQNNPLPPGSPRPSRPPAQKVPGPTQTRGRPKITAHHTNPPNHSSDNTSPNPNSWQAQNHSPSPKSPKSQFRQVLAQPKLMAGLKSQPITQIPQITVQTTPRPTQTHGRPKIPQITVQTTPRPTQTHGRPKITVHHTNPPNHSSDHLAQPKLMAGLKSPNPPNHSSDNPSPNPNSWQA